MKADAAPRAGLREWVGLAVLALPTLLLALDASVLFLALPHLGADLGPSSSQQLWILDIYGFMIAGFLITMGTLGDRIGRRRLLMIGAAAFGAASVFAAFSTSAGMLIAARAALGIRRFSGSRRGAGEPCIWERRGMTGAPPDRGVPQRGHGVPRMRTASARTLRGGR